MEDGESRIDPQFRRARQTRSRLGLRRPSASGDGAFARTRKPRAFADRRPHESGVAVSQTNRSTFAGMTASEILNPACGPDALRLIRRRAGHSRGPLQGRRRKSRRPGQGSREFWVLFEGKKNAKNARSHCIGIRSADIALGSFRNFHDSRPERGSPFDGKMEQEDCRIAESVTRRGRAGTRTACG